jgi:hypothetical protein
VLVQYLRDFSANQVDNIEYNTVVDKVTRVAADTATGDQHSGDASKGDRSELPLRRPPSSEFDPEVTRYTLLVRKQGSTAAVDVGCGVVVVATGLGVPNIPVESIQGIEHTIGCVCSSGSAHACVSSLVFVNLDVIFFSFFFFIFFFFKRHTCDCTHPVSQIQFPILFSPTSLLHPPHTDPINHACIFLCSQV